MKKYAILTISVAMLLCSCGKKEESRNLVFPKTTWDMGMDEIVDAWGLTGEDIKDYGRDDAIVIEGYELFGEKTESINFQFYDFENDGAYEFIGVLVTYPDDADMVHVAEEMQKEYGEPDPDVKFYYLNSPLGSLSAYESGEPDSVKNWASGSVGGLIPAAETETYRDEWKAYQSYLTDEDWDTFINDSRLVRISLLTDGGWNRVEYNASNQWIYETIKNSIVGKR